MRLGRMLWTFEEKEKKIFFLKTQITKERSPLLFFNSPEENSLLAGLKNLPHRNTYLHEQQLQLVQGGF